MKRTFVISLSAAAVLALPLFVGAQRNGSGTAPWSPAEPIQRDLLRHQLELRTETRENVQDIRQETRTGIQEQRVDLRSAITSGRTNLWSEVRDRIASGTPLTSDEIQAFKDKREALQEDVQSRVESFRQDVEAKREAARARIEAARQALQEKLAQFRDDRKKQIVERLAKSLDELNTKMVRQFSEIVDKLDELLVSIGSRADKAEANGRDVSAVRSALTSAQTAVAAAREAVRTQAAKTYPVNLTSEDTARTDIAPVKQALEADLKAVRTLVQAARQAVAAAAQALRQIPGVDSLEFPSGEAPSPSTP